MTDELPPAVRNAFEAADGHRIEEGTASVTSTAFDGTVSVSSAEDGAFEYRVSVVVPTLSAATTEVVGSAVADGWFDTLTRRLEDAPKATRAELELETFEVERGSEEVEITYAFTSGSPATAARVSKTLVEYVEGTYVEGIIPGYDYQPPVSTLLNRAGSGGSEADPGGTPL